MATDATSFFDARDGELNSLNGSIYEEARAIGEFDGHFTHTVAPNRGHGFSGEQLSCSDSFFFELATAIAHAT
jgi:hypothetical protein